MAFISWKTCDTNRSVMNDWSGSPHFPVAMIAPDNSRWIETCYQGFGDFGGQNVFELISLLNGGPGLKSHGAHLLFQGNPWGDFQSLADRGLTFPKFAENTEATWESLAVPVACRRKGYFEEEGAQPA